jgi:hypothetical protein
MSKHTPGPWKIDVGARTKTARGISAQTRNIVNFNGLSAPSSTQTAANARLIAAAPDLLEALRSFAAAAYPVAEAINKRGHNWSEAYLDQVLDTARAAIAKATGEQR